MKDKSHPDWTCPTCAVEAGGRIPAGIEAKWIQGKCDICGLISAITNPKNFSYPDYEKIRHRNSLTLEEHKKIAGFLRSFNENGHEIFELLKKRCPYPSRVLSAFAKAVEHMQYIRVFMEDHCDIDRIRTSGDIEESTKWITCYRGIGGWAILLEE